MTVTGRGQKASQGAAMTRIGAALLVAALSLPAPPVLAAEQTVTFPAAGGVPLEGTWTAPDADKALDMAPAVLLVQGSGPTDRNGNRENAPRSDLLDELADALAKKGVASLRFDKRGMHANAAQRPKVKDGEKTDELGAFFSWERMVADVAAALAYVAGRDDTDTARLGVIGHSQGGTLALAALTAQNTAQKTAQKTAQNTAAPPVKALVLLASPARPARDIIRLRLVRRLDQWGLEGEPRTGLIDFNDQIASKIIETGQVPEGVPRILSPVYPSYAGPFLKGWLTFDPLAALGGLKQPALIVIGTSDAQVSPSEDGALFLTVLQDRTDGSIVMLPDDVGHALQDADDRDEDEERRGDRDPDTDLLETIASWTAKAL